MKDEKGKWEDMMRNMDRKEGRGVENESYER